MINEIIHKICFFGLVFLNLSFQWPLENAKVTSIFGESRGDHFHDGVDIVSPQNKINPLDEGELAYFWDKSIFPLDNYPGGGNYKIIRHKGSVYSLYLHLNDSPVFQEMYTAKDLVGSIGDTGRSYGRHLHLSMLDYSTRKSMNPLKVLPEYPDTTGPVISEVYVKVGDRYSVIRDKANIRLTRQYPLLIDIVDSMGGRERLGIFRLTVQLNGKNALEINFTTIDCSKNGLTIYGKTFHDLFDEKGYYKVSNISYTEGINTLKIVAGDYHGNETAKEISFNVKLDIPRENSL